MLLAHSWRGLVGYVAASRVAEADAKVACGSVSDGATMSPKKGRRFQKKGGSVGNGRFTVPLRYVYVYGRNYITIRYVTVFAALYA